jgi:hypothetical protein
MLSALPTPADRRASMRFTMFRPVHYQIDRQQHLALTQDLSLGGMRLVSACPQLPPGDIVELRIPAGALLPRQEAIELRGRVVWSDNNTAGIAFIDPDQRLRERLMALFDEYLDNADACEIDAHLRQHRMEQSP